MLLPRIFDDPIFSLFDRTFPSFDRSFASTVTGPRFTALETDNELTLRAELAGMSEKDLQIGVEDGVLTIRGERKIEAPEGYVARIQERLPLKFSRSFKLPKGLDLERAEAVMKDGLLTLTIAKAPKTEPRQIAVRSA